MARVGRFGFANNRHACDFGLAEQTEQEVPEEVKEQGRRAGMRVFGSLKRHIVKNKSNVKGAFREFDRDQSGSLTPYELRQCLAALEITLDDDDFEIMVRLIDIDGNGTIDAGEFLDAIDTYGRMAEGKPPRKVAK